MDAIQPSSHGPYCACERCSSIDEELYPGARRRPLRPADLRRLAQSLNPFTQIEDRESGRAPILRHA